MIFGLQFSFKKGSKSAGRFGSFFFGREGPEWSKSANGDPKLRKDSHYGPQAIRNIHLL